MSGPLHGDLAAPAAFLAVHRASQWLTGATLCSAALLAVFVVRHSRALPPTSQRYRAARWQMYNLVALTLTCSNSFALNAAFEATEQALWCDAMQQTSAFLFGLTTWTGYWVLLVRAQATLEQDNSLHVALFRFSQLTLTYVAPIFAVVGAVVFSGRVLFQERVCALELPVLVAVCFLVIDTSFSMLLATLFFVPVRRHLVGGSPRELWVRREAIRSLRLSQLQVASTLVFHVVGVASKYAFDDDADPDNSVWRLIRLMGYTVDALLHTLALLGMTRAGPKSCCGNSSARAVQTLSPISPHSPIIGKP